MDVGPKVGNVIEKEIDRIRAGFHPRCLWILDSGVGVRMHVSVPRRRPRRRKRRKGYFGGKKSLVVVEYSREKTGSEE